MTLANRMKRPQKLAAAVNVILQTVRDEALEPVPRDVEVEERERTRTRGQAVEARDRNVLRELEVEEPGFRAVVVEEVGGLGLVGLVPAVADEVGADVDEVDVGLVPFGHGLAEEVVERFGQLVDFAAQLEREEQLVDEREDAEGLVVAPGAAVVDVEEVAVAGDVEVEVGVLSLGTLPVQDGPNGAIDVHVYVDVLGVMVACVFDPISDVVQCYLASAALIRVRWTMIPSRIDVIEAVDCDIVKARIIPTECIVANFLLIVVLPSSPAVISIVWARAFPILDPEQATNLKS